MAPVELRDRLSVQAFRGLLGLPAFSRRWMSCDGGAEPGYDMDRRATTSHVF
ncbi:MAG: hypothetical protein ACLPXU_08460 [Acidimicrobiales bacterium]